MRSQNLWMLFAVFNIWRIHSASAYDLSCIWINLSKRQKLEWQCRGGISSTTKNPFIPRSTSDNPQVIKKQTMIRTVSLWRTWQIWWNSKSYSMWKCLIVKREISFTKINDHFNFLPSTEVQKTTLQVMVISTVNLLGHPSLNKHWGSHYSILFFYIYILIIVIFFVGNQQKHGPDIHVLVLVWLCPSCVRGWYTVV